MASCAHLSIASSREDKADVRVRGHGTKRYRHPIVGEPDIRYEALQLTDEDQTLFVYSVEPESTSASALALLDSWSATPSPATTT